MYNQYFKYNYLKNINLDEFIMELSEFFYVPAQLHNFTINFSVKGEKDIRINLFYLKIIIFNLVTFIFSNSKNQNEEKNLVFSIECVPNQKLVSMGSAHSQNELSQSDFLITFLKD